MTSPGGYEAAFREVGAALNRGGDTSDALAWLVEITGHSQPAATFNA